MFSMNPANVPAAVRIMVAIEATPMALIRSDLVCLSLSMKYKVKLIITKMAAINLPQN